jgi:hypothetical protein
MLLMAPGCGSDPLVSSDAGVDSGPSPGGDTAGPDAPGSDAAGGCAYGGTTYPTGAKFPADDGCNTCTCLAGGGAACTEIACPRRDGGSPDLAACDFSARYSYGTIGGLRFSVSRTELAPGNKYTHTRSPVSGAPGSTLSCSPGMPPCGAQDVITAYDIEVHDLGRADVQAALAEPQPPLFGYDSRPVDGTVFELKRADGRGFLVGDSCDNRPPPCRPIPAGVAQLTKRLQDLDKQQLAAPECAALRGP